MKCDCDEVSDIVSWASLFIDEALNFKDEESRRKAYRMVMQKEEKPPGRDWKMFVNEAGFFECKGRE